MFPSMPTALRVDGFRFVIYLPSREHGPAHVHVYKGEGEVVAWLPIDGRAISTRAIRDMTRPDASAVVNIVSEHADFLIAEWRRYHGNG
jgi:hypothetical protein